jgi:hypothetical protein
VEPGTKWEEKEEEEEEEDDGKEVCRLRFAAAVRTPPLCTPTTSRGHAGRLAQLCDKSVSTKSAHTQG